MTAKIQKERDIVIKSALRHILFDGWSQTALLRGAQEAQCSTDLKILFPKGIRSAVLHFSDWADRGSLENIPAKTLEALRTRDRIAYCVKARFEFLANYKPAVSAALFNPMNPRALWRTADRIWWTAGDQSTDYNHYTKRLLLSSVIAATAFYWLNDNSQDHENTWHFLDRKLNSVMKVGQTLSKLRRKPA